MKGSPDIITKLGTVMFPIGIIIGCVIIINIGLQAAGAHLSYDWTYWNMFTSSINEFLKYMWVQFTSIS